MAYPSTAASATTAMTSNSAIPRGCARLPAKLLLRQSVRRPHADRAVLGFPIGEDEHVIQPRANGRRSVILVKFRPLDVARIEVVNNIVSRLEGRDSAVYHVIIC